MAVEAVIFDLDGTLIDSLASIARAANRVLETRGYPPHPEKSYRRFVGDGARQLMARALPENRRDTRTVDTCTAEYLDVYLRIGDAETRIFDGVSGMLDRLTGQKTPMAILSNKAQKAAEACAAGLLGNWRFHPVFGLGDAFPPKPDPSGALAVSRQMGIAPENLCFVGDSGVDMQTATRSGMFPLGVLWGYRTGEELADSGAAALLRRPEDLLRHIS